MRPRKRARRVLAIALVSGAWALASVLPAQAAADSQFTSIYTSGPYVDAGWAACATPITWYADTSELSAADGRKAMENLDWAMQTWAKAADLAIARGTTGPLHFDNADTIVKLDSQMAGGRRIYIKFVRKGQSSYMKGPIVGAASPTKVLLAGNEIVGGSAVFRADYLKYATRTEARALLLHELGHVFGLGHSTDKNSVMYPLVERRVKLDASDLAGIRSFVKPCVATSEAERNA